MLVPRLTPAQSHTLSESGLDCLDVMDPLTNRRYVIVDVATMTKLDTMNAIQNGIEEMERGEGQCIPVVPNRDSTTREHSRVVKGTELTADGEREE